MSEQTARLVARLRRRLQRTTRRITWAELAFGAAVAVGSVATVWLLATLLEATLWLGTTPRTALAATIGTVVVGLGAALLARPLGQLLGLISRPSEETVARKVGRHHPHVADRLVNLLQLAEGKRSHAPAPLVDQAVQDLAKDLDEVSFDEVEDFGRARRALRLASVPLAGVLAFLLIAPSTFFGASERLLAPNTEFTRPAPFDLSVAPGSVRLVRGDSLSIRVQASGAAPGNITIRRRDTVGASPEEHALRADSAGTFRHAISNVRESFEYRVEAAPVQTDWYRVEVTNRPQVRQLQLSVTPPAYTGQSSRTLDPNVGDVSGLPGSKVSVSATLGGAAVENAHLSFDDEKTRPLDVQDGKATGSFVLRREETYQIQLKSTAGTANRDPIEYQVSLQSDARPSVSFLYPEGTSEISDDLAQDLRVQLSDDYGFSQAKLFYRLTKQRFGDEQESYSSVQLPLPNSGQVDRELVHTWLLAQDTGLEPAPGDVVSYYVKAWDNDTVNGPKSGRTTTQRLRMPSLSEQYEQLNDTQEDADEQMEQLRQRSDSARQQFQQLRDELRRTREADWQNRRQLERLQEKQQSMDEGTEKLSKQVQEMQRQMQQNGLSSSEMSQKFEELQRVVDEMKSPELQKALNQLKEAMQNNNLRQMQQALDQVEKTQESHREQLERVRSLFEQLKAQQKLDEMARRANELSEDQKRLREKTQERMEQSQSDDSSSPSDDSTSTDESSEEASGDLPEDSSRTSESANDENSPSESSATSQSDMTSPQSDSTGQSSTSEQSGANEDLAAEQERAKEKMQELENKLEEATQEMEDVQSAPKKQLQELSEQLQKENLPQQMQQNSQQLRQNQLQDAQQGQQQMQKSLQKMQQQLSQMKSQMQGKQRQINLAGLRTALENTLRLSKRQEDLRTTIDELAAEGPTLRSYARDQKRLADGLTVVTDSLQSIAKRIPEMSREVQEKSGNALRAMETATSALDERDAGTATGHQKTSMMHLNELALLLSELLDQLQQQQGSGSGMSMQQMLQQLQQMSGQQQKLNNQIQQHLNDVQGERLSPGQGERQKELAKQQRRIKQQLENMDVGSDARQQIMGDLEKIAEQMDQTARDLEQGRHSRDLIERQQQILTRLLNAQQSLRTQGKEQQRRGREAEDEYEQRPPGELPSTEEADQLRRDLIRALEMGYSPDYEELIKRYFDLLEENETETP